MDRRIEVVRWVALVGAAVSLGCASSRPVPEPAQVVCPETVTREQIAQAAHDVLAGMHFSIEKLDAEQGIVRTRPLRGAQAFEFWRSDNVGGYNAAEANVQSVRRIVELRVTDQAPGQKPETADASSLQPAASGLCIECNTQIQRLALPGNQVAGVSQAYQIHTRSQSTLQTFEVTPGQRAGMAWIDLGPDPELAAEILKRIEKRLRD
jgi:hypothetical protein